MTRILDACNPERMKVVRVPKGMLIASALILGIIPFVGVQVALWKEAPYWRLPWRQMTAGVGIAFLLIMPWLLLLLKGRTWSLWVLGSQLCLWVLTSFGLAIQSERFLFGFFGMFLAAYVGFALLYAYRESIRVYFSPSLKWYEGLPKKLPGLSGTLLLEDSGVVHVSRIDHDGVFVFSPDKEIFKLRKSHALEMILKYRDLEVKVPGELTAILQNSVGKIQGAGIQFGRLIPDVRKELGDFIEKIRGEGHV